MKGKIATAATVCFVSLGCSHSVEPASRPAQPDRVSQLGDFITSETGAYDYLYTFRTDPTAQPRQPGDFIVYRFTGAKLEQPVILTQRVVGRKRGVLIVDQILDDGSESIELRLRIEDARGAGNRIISVARLVEGVQLPFGTATYEALMAKVMPPVQVTEKRIGGHRGSVQVGESSIECEKTGYRVRVDGKPAYMMVMQNPSFVWGDIGGEIRDGYGKLLYKAEIALMSTGHALPWGTEMVVAELEPDPYEGLDDPVPEPPAATIALSPPEPVAPMPVAPVVARRDHELDEEWDDLE